VNAPASIVEAGSLLSGWPPRLALVLLPLGARGRAPPAPLRRWPALRYW